MKKKTLRPVFGDKHKAYIQKAVRSTISVAEGAVRAGKTIDNVTAFAYFIEHGTPDRLHLATGSTLANAKLNIGDANGYGLEYIFRGRCRWTKYKSNEALIIHSHGRDYVVIFAGGSKADSYKKLRGNSYGMWIATEINLHHEDTIKEAFNRQLAARQRHIFWDLNPDAPGHRVYKDHIDTFADKFGDRYNYENFTIRDNATITPERLAEIERQYVPGTVWYERDIEGKRCSPEGLVYPMFNKSCIAADKERAYSEYYISMDYGIQNPTAMLLWGRCEGVWYQIAEYYHSGRETRDQKTDIQYYEALCSLAGDRPVRKLIIDPSASSFIVLVNQKRRFKVWPANNDVQAGIQHTASCLESGRIKICSSCRRTIEEYGLYKWDTEAETDTVIKTNDHAMDATRYFVNTVGVWREKAAYVPLSERGQ